MAFHQNEKNDSYTNPSVDMNDEMATDNTMTVDNAPEQIIECPLCGCFVRTCLELHFQNDHREFNCPFCGLLFNGESDLTQHVNTKHNDDQAELPFGMGQPSLVCPICNIKASDQNWLLAHVDSHFSESNISGNPVNFENNLSGQCLLLTDSTNSLIVNVDDNYGIEQTILLSDLEQADPKNSDYSNQSSDNEKPCSSAMEANKMYSDIILIEKQISPFKDNQITSEQLTEDYVTAQIIERQQLEELEQFDLQNAAFDELKEEFGMSDLNRETKASINLTKALKQNHITKSTFDKLHTQINNGSEFNSIYENDFAITMDLVQSIRQLNTNGSKLYLCGDCDHFGTTIMDSGYGCGYRNTQMLLSALRREPSLRDSLFNNRNYRIPSIYKLQQLIERAWSLGFDKAGRDQLGGRLVNTTKWIGATDIAALFLSLKVRVNLIDIDESKSGDKSNKLLFDYVKQYFLTNNGHVYPIYLQHHGHSRTIVGIEINQNQTVNLLIFDPSTKRKNLQEFKKSPSNKMLSIFRHNMSSFKLKQYQLLILNGSLCTSQFEYEQSKVLKSIKIT